MILKSAALCGVNFGSRTHGKSNETGWRRGENEQSVLEMKMCEPEVFATLLYCLLANGCLLACCCWSQSAILTIFLVLGSSLCWCGSWRKTSGGSEAQKLLGGRIRNSYVEFVPDSTGRTPQQVLVSLDVSSCCHLDVLFLPQLSREKLSKSRSFLIYRYVCSTISLPYIP